jgi:streptogramin lyase
MLCVDCELPLCYKCSTQGDHRRHELINLERVYADKMAHCLEEISKVDKYFLPTSQDIQKEIKSDAKEMKISMDSLRTAMKAQGEYLKSLVDTVVSENIQEMDNVEQTLLEKLRSQDTTFNDYISYHHDLLKEFYGLLSSKLPNIIPKLLEKFPDIRPIPETEKPVTPVFTAGQYSRDDVAKLLGKINLEDKKAEMRKIKPMENASEKSTSKQKNKKSDVKQKMSLSSSITEVREYNVPGVEGTYHISLDKPGRLWTSDDKGNLFQTDLQGNQLQKIETNAGYGYHTVTQDGELIFTDSNNKVIKKITKGNEITKSIKTRIWTPLSIHSSHINGDILVGMVNDGQAKVTRYNKTGEELQNIRRGLYEYPHYITENINGDVCVSDYDVDTVVVVNESGRHRFSYTGQGSRFSPYGICTDVLGHILVCDGVSNTVHLLDQDGQFLSLLLTSQHGVHGPCSVCVDDENNLYVGQDSTNTVAVYKYLQ